MSCAFISIERMISRRGLQQSTLQLIIVVWNTNGYSGVAPCIYIINSEGASLCWICPLIFIKEIYRLLGSLFCPEMHDKKHALLPFVLWPHDLGGKNHISLQLTLDAKRAGKRVKDQIQSLELNCATVIWVPACPPSHSLLPHNCTKNDLYKKQLYWTILVS